MDYYNDYCIESYETFQSKRKIMKKPIINFLIPIIFLLSSCGGEVLGDKCNCKLSGQEVILDSKGEYYWIEIYTESEYELFGPYSEPSHGYAAIKRCEELEKGCDKNK